MSSQIKQLTRQTAVYGAGNVLSRVVTFLLLPLFTHLLTPAEYGIATLVYAFLAFMNVVYHYGLDSAFMRQYSDTARTSEKVRCFSTAMWLILVTSGIFSLAVMTAGEALSVALLTSPQYTRIIRLAAGILFLDSLAHVPFAFLRMEEKAGRFISLKLLNVLLTLGLNIYYVAVLRRGIEGIFISVLLASGITAAAVVLTTIASLRAKFSIRLANSLVKFGLPFVPAGLASIAMEMIDRYILAALKDTATVGIYSAGYKLGIFMLLLTTAFNYAWQPFFLKTGKEPGSRPLFARIFNYFLLIALFAWVAVSAFIHEIIRVRVSGFSLIGPEFYGAESIVPLILLAYVFQGTYLNFLPGIYLKKKTQYIPLITASGAFGNIVLNFLLIPSYGMTGAAAATVAGHFVMAAMTFTITKRFFPVPYQWGKTFRLGLAAAVSLGVIFLLGGSILAKLGGLSLYVIGVLVLRVVSLEEVKKIALIFARDNGNASHSP